MSLIVSFFILTYPVVCFSCIPLHLWFRRGQRRLSLWFALTSIMTFMTVYIFVLTHNDIGRISMEAFWFILSIPLIVLIVQAVVCEVLYVKERRGL